ncbi:MAG: hypothetical protein ACYC6C_05885 [Coriobacteriia bacterium]
MRRLFAALIVVMLAFSLTGCGGGGEEEATTGETAVQTQPAGTPAAPVAVSGEATTFDLSGGEEQKFEPFPVSEEVVPDVISQRILARKPMLVFFYDSQQKTTDDQRAAIDAVLAEYRGTIDLVSFDAGKYVTVDESGTATVRPGMEDDGTAERVARLMGADNLNVRFTPYLVFVDRQGYITYRYRGYVDESAIEREVLRATE